MDKVIRAFMSESIKLRISFNKGLTKIIEYLVSNDQEMTQCLLNIPSLEKLPKEKDIIDAMEQCSEKLPNTLKKTHNSVKDVSLNEFSVFYNDCGESINKNTPIEKLYRAM